MLPTENDWSGTESDALPSRGRALRGRFHRSGEHRHEL